MGRSGGLMARKTSFYYSFLVLPADQRRAIEGVWDFCRAVDDAVDEPVATVFDSAQASPEQRRGALSSRDAVTFWRAELARCYDGRMPETPEGRGLQPFIARFDL